MRIGIFRVERDWLTGISGSEWSYWLQKMGATQVEVQEETEGFLVTAVSDLFDEFDTYSLKAYPTYEVGFHKKDDPDEDYITVRRLNA